MKAKLYGGWSWHMWMTSSFAPLNPFWKPSRTSSKRLWKTPTPEYVSEHPIRFLGMEVSKKKAEDGEREEWYVTQRSCIKDLVEKSEEKAKERKIPSLEIKLTSKHQHRHQHLTKCEAPKDALEKFFGFSPAHVMT